MTVSSGESEARRAQALGQLTIDDDFWESDANEQLELLLDARLPAFQQERLTVERLVEMGILKHQGTSVVEIEQHDGSPVTVEVRSYRKA